MSYIMKLPYAYDVRLESDMSALDASASPENPDMAQQQFKDDADINIIVDRFTRTGEVPQFSARASFGDFLDYPSSFREALDQINEAQASFMDLPSDVRSRFDNDPAKFLDFVAHDDGSGLKELGLVNVDDNIDNPAPQGQAEPAESA